MNDLLIFGLLLVAVASGWFLGRRSAPAAAVDGVGAHDEVRGLNYRLQDRPDRAPDRAVAGLQVNSDTLDTHMALGQLLRRKGEVERAIRVHQNLLLESALPVEQSDLAQLELALDFIAAGLLDRAERLLLELSEASGEHRHSAQRHLLDIYRTQSDWERAAGLAEAMLQRGPGGDSMGQGGGQPVALMLSHFRCELAASRLADGAAEEARALLHTVLRQDPDCARASLMLGDVESASGRHREAIDALRRVARQDPDYLAETIPTMRHCCAALGKEEDLRQWLQAALEQSPTAAVVMAVAEDMSGAEGVDAACEFLSHQLEEQPSLRGLEQLITLQLDASDGRARDDLGLLQVLVRRLLADRPAYRCGHCGFAGRQLHWACPGCSRWGSIKGIRGAPEE